MSNITCVIVDDEQSGIYTLEYMLKEHCSQVKVLQTFESSIEALKGIKALQPDLLFLDIKMPNLNGLELLNLLGPKMYKSIFITAHDGYMLQALRLHAFDYLIKPFNEGELIEAIERIEQMNEADIPQIPKEMFEINLDTKLSIKVGNKKQFAKLSEINFFKSSGNKAIVFLVKGENIQCSDSLGVMEKRLPEKYFFRCHNEYLVNKHCIREYVKDSILMEDNQRVPISKGRRKDVQDIIDDLP